jgi:putative FmdB family regulatory protein
MPLYDYACTKCGRTHEVRHGFDEGYEQPCEACGGAMRRVFNPAPVLFKGSGFYVTDSRRSSSDSKAEKPKKEEAASSKPESAGGSESKAAPKSAESAA